MMDRIDAHMHVWQLARGDYDWLTPDLGQIYRDFAIDDVWDAAEACGIGRTILVQAAASAAETDYLLSIARSDPRVAGVVGWLAMDSDTAVKEIERRAADRKLLGLRPMIGDIADPSWILRDEVEPALRAMASTGLVFDAHARPDLISVMETLARRHPDLQIVLNHGGKPPIDSGKLDTWRQDLSSLAQCGNVACKLSGLLTEAGPACGDDTIGAVVETMGACFGAERLIWGSDWPVLTLASTYQRWAQQSERLINRHFPGKTADIWRSNARRIYLERTSNWPD